MRIAIVLAGVLLAGCGRSLPENQPGAGEIRLALFRECMVLAKDTVQAGHYNDSAEVIDACSSQAYYMTNQIMLSGGRRAADQ